MYQSEFNPVTIEMQMTLSEEASLNHWAEISRYYFNAYAQEITKGEKIYIGHIKVFATVNESSYFKLSIFKPTIPAEVDIQGDAWTSKLSLLVNSFVYGIDEETTMKVLESVSEKMEKEFMVKTKFTLKPVHMHGHHHHEHDH
ncbi:hypothetical protein [Alkalibacter mobilis]|uniref:hypothetical protein n=1 Tax=Alkalibacter mobilis TaxID=2787712 RepID=UPI0018A04D7D|nr:hypothetical protein [Alkalibacter mobilis]MBF7095672.1 hypothetical protein [Alkalibacter mobilis]